MRLLAVAAVLAAASGAAFAQTAPGPSAPNQTTYTGAQTPGGTFNTTPQTVSPSPSAVQTQNTTQRTAAAPVPGRNSFTRDQAVRRISSAGYEKVAGLKKDSLGIWRGTARNGGNPVAVAPDYQGNVVSHQAVSC
jgi:hypothetical protein